MIDRLIQLVLNNIVLDLLWISDKPPPGYGGAER